MKPLQTKSDAAVKGRGIKNNAFERKRNGPTQKGTEREGGKVEGTKEKRDKKWQTTLSVTALAGFTVRGKRGTAWGIGE